MARPQQGGLLDLLEAAAAGRGTVSFLPDEPTPVPFAALWRRSAACARWFRNRRSGPGGRVAALLTASADVLAGLAGAWRAGQSMVSLPLPSRAMSATEYGSLLDRCCVASGAEYVLVEDRYRQLLPPLRVPTLSFGQCTLEGSAGEDYSGGELVQFTSGSTGEPRGVRLGLDAVAANLLAILEVLEPRRGDVACSWLPLSHDMGLVGMCLSSWVAAAPGLADRSRLCLIRPEAFAADPSIWMRACSEFRATVTAAPTFGYALAGRVMARSGQLDLSTLRACLVGAESVRPDVLQRFAAVTSSAGFDPTALCPAYGLAEASVAVTINPPHLPWAYRELDPTGLAEGRLQVASGQLARQVVSCGPPVPGVEVRIAGAEREPDRVGAIEIRGPSLMTGYVPESQQKPSPEGWFTTSDVGFLVEGELHVVGRSDDMIVVRGRNVSAVDIDAAVAEHADVRPGGVTSVQAVGGYTVAVEPGARPTAYRALAMEIDGLLVRRLGIGPQRIVFVEPDGLPKTSSGKVARHRVAALVECGELATLASVELRPHHTFAGAADEH